MSLEHILLGMLRTPASGYDLKTAFDEGTRYFWSAELSQIYPTLQRMQKRGWLMSREVASEKGPARRVYQRTTKGTQALHAWLQDDPQVGTERFAYLGQLIYMGELHDLQATLKFLQQLRERLSATLHYLRTAYEGMRESSPEGRNDLDDEAFHEWLCLRMGVQSLSAKVTWCDEAIGLVSDRLARGKAHD